MVDAEHAQAPVGEAQSQRQPHAPEADHRDGPCCVHDVLSGRRRPRHVGRGHVGRGRFGRGHAGQRREARLGLVSADLARERDPVEPRDLALALDAGGMVGWETADQRLDPLAQLQREVRGRGAHQLTNVLDGHLAARAQPIWMLSLAHFCGTTSRRLSISAWTATEIVLGSPITQPWL